MLLTSGYPLETLIQHGRIQSGAVVLTKPYRKATLARRLREILLVGSLSGASTKPVSAPASGTDGSA